MTLPVNWSEDLFLITYVKHDQELHIHLKEGFLFFLSPQQGMPDLK